MVDGTVGVQKKSVLQRAGYSIFGLTKRLMNRRINNILDLNADVDISTLPKYDNYGFSVNENEFASNIQLYESEFDVKRERRLRRWELVPVDTPLINCNPDELKILIRKGIPDHLRCLMWMKFLKSDELMSSNPNVYKSMVDKPLDEDTVSQIDMDINRTFPNHKNYQGNTFTKNSLKNVLMAFASYMPCVSYCQSLNFIVASLLIFMDEEEAFWSLVQIINSQTPGYGLDLAGYYKGGMYDLKRDILVLEYMLEKRLKKLYRKLKNNGVDLICISAEWFLCLFTISLPMTTVFRAWDSLFFEGEKVLFRIAFALFKLHETRILKLDSDKDLLIYCKSMSKCVLQHDEFLKIAFYNLSSFSRKDIQLYRKRAMQELKQTNSNF